MDYRWVAQDADGQVWGFWKSEPRQAGKIWENADDWPMAAMNIGKGFPNPNWKNSLIDLEKEDFAIVDGILVRKTRPEAKKELTDTELLDAIEEHSLIVDRNVESKNAITVWNKDDFTGATSKKGNIRKAIKKWLKKNVDKKELTE